MCAETGSDYPLARERFPRVHHRVVINEDHIALLPLECHLQLLHEQHGVLNDLPIQMRSIGELDCELSFIPHVIPP
eukprot:7316-Eustigmatos_ZCMA.PRE.1